LEAQTSLNDITQAFDSMEGDLHFYCKYNKVELQHRASLYARVERGCRRSHYGLAPPSNAMKLKGFIASYFYAPIAVTFTPTSAGGPKYRLLVTRASTPLAAYSATLS